MKQQLKTLKEELKETRDEVNRWIDYANDIDAKLKTALQRLETMANGSFYKDECNPTDSDSHRSQKTAGMGLLKISRMQERKP